MSVLSKYGLATRTEKAVALLLWQQEGQGY
jgi:hypothetical protein